MRDRYKTNLFPMGYMDFDLYKKIIDQLPTGTEIDFHKDGEPLLHPDLAQMIRYAVDNFMFTHVVTNGILLAQEKENLVSSGLHLLTVSLIDKIPYDSINEFMDYKGIDGPTLQLKLYRDVDVLPMADKVIFRELHNWTDDEARKSRKPCGKLRDYAAVNWDGGYAICCVDYKREMVPFNVKDAPLEMGFEFSKMLYRWQQEGVFLPPCNKCNYWVE